MLVSKTLCFLFLIALATSTPLTQAEAQTFIQANGLVPPTATFQSFVITPSGERVVLMYKDGQAGFKFVLNKDDQGKPNLLFKEELLSIGFGGMGQAVEIEIMPEIMIQTMPLPIPMPVQIPTPFNQPFFGPRNNHRRNSQLGHRRFKQNQNQPCKLNEQQITTQLKENLEIFKDAQIKEIRKVGFEFGTGLLLEIDLSSQNKDYTIHAGYIPRHKKLNVIKIIEVKAEQKKINPLETGKELIGKVISNMETPLKSVQNVGLKFENIIQSFVEKLLVRKNLKLGENEIFEQEHPLVGQEGEQFMPAPILLGSEGEPEMPVPLLLGSEGEQERIETVQSNPQQHIFKEQTEEIHEHTEQKSEEISELVTEVLSKLKLKTK